MIESVKAFFCMVGRFFSGCPGNGWVIADTRNGRVALKRMRMSDGTFSCAGIGRGFVVIYLQEGERKDPHSLRPVHVLLDTSMENLSRFYNSEHSSEIFTVFNRLNQIRSD